MLYLGGERNRATVRARLTLERVAEALYIPFVLSVTKSWHHCAQAWVIRTLDQRPWAAFWKCQFTRDLQWLFLSNHYCQETVNCVFRSDVQKKWPGKTSAFYKLGFSLKSSPTLGPCLVNTWMSLKFKCSAGTWPLRGRDSSPGTLCLLTEAKHKKALMV